MLDKQGYAAYLVRKKSSGKANHTLQQELGLKALTQNLFIQGLIERNR